MFCKLRRLELFRSGQLSDCELHVWHTDKCQCKKIRTRQFRCHRIMLASASEKFDLLMKDENFEKNNHVILLNDASPDAYETLLLYIYTFEIYNDISFEMCKDLIYLAVKYEMPDFMDSYIKKLAHQDWPMGRVLQIFHLANEHNRPALMDLVKQKITPIADQLLNDNSFLEFNIKELHALMTILKSTGTIPDSELLQSLKKYQIENNLDYKNMRCFQKFVEVAHLFGDVLFEPDGKLALPEENTNTEGEGYETQE